MIIYILLCVHVRQSMVIDTTAISAEGPHLKLLHASTELWDVAHKLKAAPHGGQHVSNLLQFPAGKGTLNALKQL